MKHDTKKLSSGQTVDIFDDMYDFDEIVKFAVFFQNSFFKLEGKATPLLEETYYPPTWKSIYSPSDIDNLGIFNNPNIRSINEIIGDRKFVTAWVNCFTPCSIAYYHTDSLKIDNGKTFLYYGNTEWRREQGGETMLYNSQMNPEIVIEYKPNRVVVYDSDIPHKPLQHLPASTPYRFTFISLFKSTKES